MPTYTGFAESLTSTNAIAWAQHLANTSRYAFAGRADAVVTCPITKEGLKAAGVPFPGHTEYLAHLCATVPNVRIMEIDVDKSLSVSNDIAEGFESRTQRLFVDFLGRAKGSAEEVRCDLYIALDRKYITQEDFARSYDLADKTARQIANQLER